MLLCFLNIHLTTGFSALALRLLGQVDQSVMKKFRRVIRSRICRGRFSVIRLFPLL